MLCCAYRLRRSTSRKSIGNQLEVDGESVVMSNGENTAEDRKLPPRHPRMYLIRRMLFHANETYKNTLAFESISKALWDPGSRSAFSLVIDFQFSNKSHWTSVKLRPEATIKVFLVFWFHNRLPIASRWTFFQQFSVTRSLSQLPSRTNYSAEVSIRRSEVLQMLLS